METREVNIIPLKATLTGEPKSIAFSRVIRVKRMQGLFNFDGNQRLIYDECNMLLL